MTRALWLASPLLALSAHAAELPPTGQWGLPEETVEVIEPHESSPEREVRIRYRGFAAAAVLDRLFGTRWKAPDTALAFFGRDGYRSVVPTRQFQENKAWFAVSRDDGAAFAVDNPRQNQQDVPLGPYYLIWDNLAQSGPKSEYDWAYQVVRAELVTPADYASIRPPSNSKELTEGFGYAEKYCLTCHKLGGIGGGKFAGDLGALARGLNDTDLKSWILAPSKVRTNTTMPPLDTLAPASARNLIADRIIGYLRFIGR